MTAQVDQRWLPRATTRKQRLFVCGCMRLGPGGLWGRLPGPLRAAFVVSELCADNVRPRPRLFDARQAARAALPPCPRHPAPWEDYLRWHTLWYGLSLATARC